MSKGWESSAEIDQIAAALAEALPELDEIKATNTAKVPTKAGGEYSYKYADLATALGTVRPILAKHGLVVLQSSHGGHGDVAVSTTLMHRSGQWIASDSLALPAGDTPQTAGSAISYARRYQLLPALGLATEDDDGARASAPRQSRPPRPQAIDRSKFLAAVEAAGLTEQAVCEAASRGQRFAVDQFDDDEGDVLRAAFKRLKDAAEGTITSPPGGTGAEPTPPGAALLEGSAA